MMRFWLLSVLVITLAACSLTDVPVSTVTPPATEIVSQPVVFFVESQNVQDNTRQVGCESFIVPVNMDNTRTSDSANNIRAALEALVTTDNFDEEGLRNIFAEQNLTVDSVTIEDDTAIVEFSGAMMLIGTCADALLTAQVLYTIFENSDVSSTRVLVGGQNLKQLMDVSGMPIAPDTIYTRQEVMP